MLSAVIAKPIISADSHVAEPADMYEGRLARKFADNAPKVVRRPQGGDVFVIPGMNDFPINMASAAGKRGDALAAHAFVGLEDCHQGAWDPKQRVLDQERDGVAAEVLYPSMGMYLCNHPDPAYRSALFGAYNEWIAEYCAFAPSRLFALGQTALTSPEEGVADLERIKRLGLKGVMLPGYPGAEDYDSRLYDPFWEAAVDLRLPVSFHVFTYSGSLGKRRGSKLNLFLSMIRGNQDAIGLMIFGGVFERHPKLKLVCAEADAGWAPHFAARMDHALERSPHWLGDVTLSRKPSEYFFDNIYLTFQDDITAIKVKDLLNSERVMWASDFPHLDSTWPQSQDVLRQFTPGLSEREKSSLLHDNVANLYGLSI